MDEPEQAYHGGKAAGDCVIGFLHQALVLDDAGATEAAQKRRAAYAGGL